MNLKDRLYRTKLTCDKYNVHLSQQDISDVTKLSYYIYKDYKNKEKYMGYVIRDISFFGFYRVFELLHSLVPPKVKIKKGINASFGFPINADDSLPEHLFIHLVGSKSFNNINNTLQGVYNNSKYSKLNELFLNKLYILSIFKSLFIGNDLVNVFLTDYTTYTISKNKENVLFDFNEDFERLSNRVDESLYLKHLVNIPY